MRFRARRADSPRAATRRIVHTSSGPLVLEIDNFVGHLSVTANAFDEDGWEARSRRVGWREPGFYGRGRGYEARGGRETLGEAIAAASHIPRDEADRIAADTLLTWETHISGTELAQAREARTWFLGLTIVVGLFAIAFVALLVLVLVTLVF